MTGPVAPRFYTTVRPPPTELLAITYFGPLVLPTPVGTRLPRPSDTEDTIGGFLRVEAAGGVFRPDQIFYDVSIILHAYAPNSQEAVAEQLLADALAWGGNAEGTTTAMSNGDQWYVTYSRISGLPMRKADPMVALTRYRGMITWRIPGLPMREPGDYMRIMPPPLPATSAPSGFIAPPARKAPPTNVPRPTRKGPPATSLPGGSRR